MLAVGSGTGAYTLFLSRLDSDGNIIEQKSQSGTASPGAQSTLSANVASLGDVNMDSKIDCSDLVIIRMSFGKRTGQAGFDSRADVNPDGIIDVRDLVIRLAAFTRWDPLPVE
ncbi:MAG: dockerin type I domain-containing protein [Bryobacteraceae bacterium]